MKALIFDLDDTLLNSQKRIGEKTKRALVVCNNAGYRLIIATSRPIRSVQDFIDKEILSLFTIITLNGCVVYEPDALEYPRTMGCLGSCFFELLGKVMTLEPMPHISIEIDGRKFATNQQLSEKELREYHSATPDMVIPLDKVSPEKVCKLAVDGLGHKLDACMQFSSDYRNLRFIPAAGNTFVNIVPSGIDKSTTILALAEKENIDLKNSYAFGDDFPDFEMLRIVGNSVVMGNGEESLKRNADFVIGHCDEDSIGTFLFERVLGY
ncbi:MAG: HAD family hydrolase [Alphaproteobacteria bacterium]|nr:HAD family hydrolase [Alphaproteobacteria bacterium]